MGHSGLGLARHERSDRSWPQPPRVQWRLLASSTGQLAPPPRANKEGHALRWARATLSTGKASAASPASTRRSPRALFDCRRPQLLQMSSRGLAGAPPSRARAARYRLDGRCRPATPGLLVDLAGRRVEAFASSMASLSGVEVLERGQGQDGEPSQRQPRGRRRRPSQIQAPSSAYLRRGARRRSPPSARLSSQDAASRSHAARESIEQPRPRTARASLQASRRARQAPPRATKQRGRRPRERRPEARPRAAWPPAPLALPPCQLAAALHTGSSGCFGHRPGDDRVDPAGSSGRSP